MDNIFVERLAEAIKPLKQGAFADKLGIGRSQFNRYATGKRQPPVDLLVKISMESGYSVDWLLGLRPEGVESDTRKSIADTRQKLLTALIEKIREAVDDFTFADTLVDDDIWAAFEDSLKNPSVLAPKGISEKVLKSFIKLSHAGREEVLKLLDGLEKRESHKARKTARKGKRP